MGSAALWLSIAAAALAGASGQDSKKDDPSKIIGGHTEHIDDEKFMVQVLWVDVTTFAVSVCGGSLLSDRHALTAAHCVPDQNNIMTVAEGTIVYGASEFNSRGKNGVRSAVAAFQRHPKFVTVREGQSEAGHYDVAVIRLRDPAKLGPKVGTIKITVPNAEPKAGSDLNVSGWGVYKIKPAVLSRKLRTGTYKVISRDSCLKSFGPKFFTNTEICVSAIPTSSYCQGDSGGPGYQGGTQYSIVSSGSCGKDGYGIMTNLANPEVNKFIQDQLKIK